MTRNSASARPNPEKIAKVKDLFPQYGGGFIEKCLHYFGSDPNDVIIAFLENNLPPHLSNLNTKLEEIETFEENNSSIILNNFVENNSSSISKNEGVLNGKQAQQILEETTNSTAIKLFSCLTTIFKNCKETFYTDHDLENHVLKDHHSNNHEMKTRVDVNEEHLKKYNPDYNILAKSNRLDTFSKGSWKCMFISPEKLANAGFVYTGREDCVQCIFCAGVDWDWKEGDDPFLEHKKSSPRCPGFFDKKRGRPPKKQLIMDEKVSDNAQEENLTKNEIVHNDLHDNSMTYKSFKKFSTVKTILEDGLKQDFITDNLTNSISSESNMDSNNSNSDLFYNKCEFCEKTFDTKNNLRLKWRYHVYSQHFKKEIDNEIDWKPTGTVCPIKNCNHSAKSKGNLINHYIGASHGILDKYIDSKRKGMNEKNNVPIVQDIIENPEEEVDDDIVKYTNELSDLDSDDSDIILKDQCRLIPVRVKIKRNKITEEMANNLRSNQKRLAEELLIGNDRTQRARVDITSNPEAEVDLKFDSKFNSKLDLTINKTEVDEKMPPFANKKGELYKGHSIVDMNYKEMEQNDHMISDEILKSSIEIKEENLTFLDILHVASNLENDIVVSEKANNCVDSSDPCLNLNINDIRTDLENIICHTKTRSDCTKIAVFKCTDCTEFFDTPLTYTYFCGPCKLYHNKEWAHQNLEKIHDDDDSKNHHKKGKQSKIIFDNRQKSQMECVVMVSPLRQECSTDIEIDGNLKDSTISKEKFQNTTGKIDQYNINKSQETLSKESKIQVQITIDGDSSNVKWIKTHMSPSLGDIKKVLSKKRYGITDVEAYEYAAKTSKNGKDGVEDIEEDDSILPMFGKIIELEMYSC